ncbi:MAG TPA: phosphatase PAP2 family protein [Gaiellaceae bacterium]
MLARRYGLLQIGIAAAGVETYELLRRMMRPDWPLAIRHAQEVLSLERVLHLDWEDPLQAAVLRVPDLLRALEGFYFVAHFAITAVFFLWLYRRSLDGFRLFRNVFLVSTAIALVVHRLFPTAPPRLADIGLVHPGFGLAGLSNPVAAVPSLHAGWALGVGIGVVVYGRGWWRVAGGLYPLTVVFTIVATGNHFVVDAIAGMLVLGLGFAVERVRPRLRASSRDARRRTSTLQRSA